jgi:hypothetical protein
LAKVIAECASVHDAATHIHSTQPDWDFAADYYDAIDLFDWNQSDIPPAIPRFEKIATAFPRGLASGYHLFTEYRDAVNYAIVPYSLKKNGLALPLQGSPDSLPPELAEQVISDDPYVAIGVTPLLAFVEASGAIVEHEKGYRAHLIRVVSLYSDGRKRARQELADNIGWPGEIKKYRKLRKMQNPSDTELRRLDCD